ncbi:T9SS type A sorting domain-containing protein [Candidatus Neomarinimicrobiota bacterium]
MIRIRKVYRVLMFGLVALSPLMAQYTYEELLFLPWGKQENQAGFRKSPGGQYGPMSFAIAAESRDIILLDSQNRLIKLFNRDGIQLLRSVLLPSQSTDDIVWKGEQHYYLLDANVVAEYRNGAVLYRFSTESPTSAISSLSTDFMGAPVFVVNGSYALRQDPATLSKTIRQDGIPLTNADGMLRIIRRNSSRASVMINNEIVVVVEQEHLGAVRYLGSTPGDRHYIYYEIIEQHVPLRVARRVDLVDSGGNVTARFDIPILAHTYIFKEFFIDRDGSLYKMISTNDGVYIVGWILDPDAEFPTIMLEYPVPDKFIGSDHYNRLEELDTDARKPVVKDGLFAFPTVTPGEALSKADTYVQHAYTVTSANITNGRILDPNGAEVETPEWVRPGIVSPVVYQWGGFYTLTEFDAGLAIGRYAGDKATTGVSAYAVGVDCSGFVSRCWNLPYQFSTRMMDDEITIAYSSWDEIRPGDAIHKPGHVRLLVERNPDGSLLAVESAGYNWRVWYRNYTLSDLSDYTPRYYINMTGPPGSFPRPDLSYVTGGENPMIFWRDLSGSDAFGIRLYMSGSSGGWEDQLDGNLLSIGTTERALDVVDDPPLFFRLHTISPEDSVTESLPSDSYGFHTGSKATRILVVDGFDRYGGSGSYPYPYHAFAQRLGLAIAQYDHTFDTAENDAVMNGNITLDAYDAVIWSLGDESTEDETFSSSEQTLVKEYLKQGGRLFVSGSEIAWDLDYRGSATDKGFIHDYLKTAYKADDAGSYRVTGVPGTVFEDLTLNFDDGSHGVYGEDYPDAFNTNGSQAALVYGNGQIAALQFQGLVPGGVDTAKIVIMGFPFETIYNESERIALLSQVFEFFEFDTATDTMDRPFVLDQNYPNPFVSESTLNYRVSTLSNVTCSIFNLKGQLVKHWSRPNTSPGDHEIVWNGTNTKGQRVASGVYFYQLMAGNYSQTRKMVLIK